MYAQGKAPNPLYSLAPPLPIFNPVELHLSKQAHTFGSPLSLSIRVPYLARSILAPFSMQIVPRLLYLNSAASAKHECIISLHHLKESVSHNPLFCPLFPPSLFQYHESIQASARLFLNPVVTRQCMPSKKKKKASTTPPFLEIICMSGITRRKVFPNDNPISFDLRPK